jgi:hypothetical protein
MVEDLKLRQTGHLVSAVLEKEASALASLQACDEETNTDIPLGISG